MMMSMNKFIPFFPYRDKWFLSLEEAFFLTQFFSSFRSITVACWLFMMNWLFFQCCAIGVINTEKSYANLYKIHMVSQFSSFIQSYRKVCVFAWSSRPTISAFFQEGGEKKELRTRRNRVKKNHIMVEWNLAHSLSVIGSEQEV